MEPNIVRIPPRARKYYQTTNIQTRPVTKETGRAHWLLAFGTGMLIIVAILFIAQSVVIPSYHRLINRWQYGQYPVTHTTADIGHAGESDIYAMGTQGIAVVVIVTRGKVEAYEVPLSNVSTQSVVLVSIMDLNSDNKPDLVVHVDGMDTSTVLYNNGHAFQARP